MRLRDDGRTLHELDPHRRLSLGGRFGVWLPNQLGRCYCRELVDNQIGNGRHKGLVPEDSRFKGMGKCRNCTNDEWFCETCYSLYYYHDDREASLREAWDAYEKLRKLRKIKREREKRKQKEKSKKQEEKDANFRICTFYENIKLCEIETFLQNKHVTIVENVFLGTFDIRPGNRLIHSVLHAKTESRRNIAKWFLKACFS